MVVMAVFHSCRTSKICTGKMIRRIRDYGKKEPCRDAHKIYIVCEGRETEPNYFSFFEACSSNLEIITIPPTNGTDTIKLMEEAKSQLSGDNRKYTVEYEHGDTVWFVFDTDLNEFEDKIAPLRTFCDEKNSFISDKLDEVKPYKAWNMAQSNPSFEVWLYYHFYTNVPKSDDVEKFASFKDYVNSCISGGFDYQKDPVRLEDAIKNASDNFINNNDGTLACYSTEMIHLGKEILNFTKTELDKLRNKLG